MKLTCAQSGSLVPAYLDAELSEEQAAPLRAHLFDCPACREVAKAEKSLKRWFVDLPAAAVPVGFAARVARRAFAGDPGAPPLAPFPYEAATRVEAERSLLSFVLRSTAVAAGLLLALATAIQVRSLPEGRGLEAQPRPPWEREGRAVPGDRERPDGAVLPVPLPVHDAAHPDEAPDPELEEGTPHRR